MIQEGEAVTLSNGREYICFSTAEENGKNYAYLMTMEKPIEIRFAEQTMQDDGQLDVRMIQDREEKVRLLRLFQQINGAKAAAAE